MNHTDFLRLAFATEQDINWDAAWVKIIPNQPLFLGKGHIGCPLVAGTLILLVDGKTRPVEKLIASDRLHAGPNGPASNATSKSHNHCVAGKSSVELISFSKSCHNQLGRE